MKTLEGYTICIVEGNDFTLVLPLKSRTYEACRPIDEDIIIRDLQDVVVKIGADVYQCTLEDDGLHVRVEGTLARGNYSVQLTAKYHGIDIHAAYMNALSIVAWNNYSNAQQYLTGSPVVMPAAYVLGVMTDAETEALKAELRLKIAAAEQAKEDADAAKADWEQKAAELDGIAQQGTNPDATNTAILAELQTGSVAKESTSQSILSGLQNIISSHIIRGINLGGIILQDGFTPSNAADLLAHEEKIEEINDDEVLTVGPFMGYFPECKKIRFENVVLMDGLGRMVFDRDAFPNLVEADFPNLTVVQNVQNYYLPFSRIQTLRTLKVPKMSSFPFLRENGAFVMDVWIGAYFNSNVNMSSWGTATTSGKNLSDTSMNLLTEEDIAAGFTSNAEKLLWNVRNHIAAFLPDRTGQTPYTITFDAVLKAAIQADPETAAAFTNKYWNIA